MTTPAVAPLRPAPGGLALLAAVAAVAAVAAPGCVGHRQYNVEPDEFLQVLEAAPAVDADATPSAEIPPADLAIVEFDEHGILWDRAQLDATLELIRRRNAEAERGAIVMVFVHGWQNDADPTRTKGSLVEFRRTLREAARTQHELPGRNADRVVGVFIGWRGDTSDLPLLDQTTFWDRRRAAERVVSLQMRETMYRIMETASERPSSKCFVFGHSMGGLIVGRTLAPTVTALLLDGGERGVRLPADLVLLENPALDGLAAWQLLDFLKRTGARAELRMPDGTVEPAEGPVIVSITSEADTALGVAYGFGQTLGNLLTAFRGDHRPGRPSQRALATTAHGLVDELVSHRARMVDGELVLERVPGAWNDTPFWVIRVDREISSGHGDIRNPRYGALIERLFRLNRGYQTGVKTWLRTDSDPAATEPGT